MEEVQNIAVDHNADAKRNRLLTICALLSPFLIIFLDSVVIENGSFFAEKIGVKIGNNLGMALALWFAYLMIPSLSIVAFIQTTFKQKFFLFFGLILILFPVAWLTLMYVGMGLYNVHP